MSTNLRAFPESVADLLRLRWLVPPSQALRSSDWPTRLLCALILAGTLLRIFASLAWWPTIPTFADAWPYAYYAGHAVFADPQHPAGYSIFLGFIGLFTRQVAVVSVVQHLLGIATAVALFKAVKRCLGSGWPALVPAAIVLLGADQVYEEQVVQSEPLSGLLLALGMYAAVRAADSQRHRIQWCLCSGALAAAATIVRTEIAVACVALAVGLLVMTPRPRKAQWRSPAVLLLTAAVFLLAYGGVKEITQGQFQLGPSPGWQLYSTAATFANCDDFTPPAGTAALCQTLPPSKRPGNGYYLWDPSSPAVRLFHHFGRDDSKLEAWSVAAIESEPGPFLHRVYQTARDYFFASLAGHTPGGGADLDGNSDWAIPGTPSSIKVTITGMETFFAPFHVVRRAGLTQALYHYQRVFRFTSTLLTISTLLILIALMFGSSRVRGALILFGVGALACLIPETLTDNYLGRYTVPIAGPMGGAAGIAVWLIVLKLRTIVSARRRTDLATESGHERPSNT